MSDFLVELGANANARKVIQALGLPLPIPQRLRRAAGPWEARPLADRAVYVGTAGEGSSFSAALPTALAEAGANPFVIGPITQPWVDAGQAWGRPARSVGAIEIAEGAPPFALVADATGASTVADLSALYDLFHPRLRALSRNGRCVVIGRIPEQATSVEQRAVRRALEGFVRSLAREVGGKGATANTLLVGDGSDAHAAAPLRWLLSPHAAFVSGQPLVVSGTGPARPAWTRPLDGKVAIVTGAARGIGEATAQVLAREGARVLCLDRPADAEPLAAVAARCGGTPLGVDVTDPDAAAKILAALGSDDRIDVIVHNAGITRDKTLANMDRDRWDLTLAINLSAILRTTDALLPRVSDGGRVIALSSVAGLSGNFGQTNYSASKAGVIGFVEAASTAFARRRITVNGIAPGFIETRLTAAIPATTREAGRRMSALVQGGLPVDIAEAITFFASPGSAGISGQVLRVCGGAFLGS